MAGFGGPDRATGTASNTRNILIISVGFPLPIGVCPILFLLLDKDFDSGGGYGVDELSQ